MKKTLFTLFLSTTIFAQEKATDLVGLSLNFIGFGIQYEKAINDNLTGQAAVEYMGVFYSTGHVLDFDLKGLYTLKLSLEGRYYYNFDRRLGKGKNTKNNSGNYIALKGDYVPDWLTAKTDDVTINPQGTITINYGLKRSFSQNFFYEFYTGLGLALYQETYAIHDFENYTTSEGKRTINGFALDLGFRVGYNF